MDRPELQGEKNAKRNSLHAQVHHESGLGFNPNPNAIHDIHSEQKMENMADNKNIQVIIVSCAKLLSGVLLLIGSIYTHLDLYDNPRVGGAPSKVNSDSRCYNIGRYGDHLYYYVCNLDLRSGMFIAGAFFFSLALILEKMWMKTSRHCCNCCCCKNFQFYVTAFGSILLFSTVITDLVLGKLYLTNEKYGLEKHTKYLGQFIWMVGGIVTGIGNLLLAFSQEKCGWIALSYIPASIGALLFFGAGLVRIPVLFYGNAEYRPLMDMDLVAGEFNIYALPKYRSFSAIFH